MGFFDLNIPYYESDRHVTDKSSLKGRRLKLVLKAMELGYTGVAYNRILKGVMSESDRCATPLFPLSKLTPSSSSFFAAVKLHRELLNIPVSSPFRQYTRLTVIVDIPSQASALNAGNPILKSYDIVAVRPMNQNAFDQACQASEVDMIAIDFSEKLPFRLKQPMVKAAIKRGLYFEITYSGLIADAQSRRQMISNCKLLVDWTRGKNLIFCSAAPSATELRGPQDVSNLFFLLGLPMERAKLAISKNCRSLLANALRKKYFYKEAVKVEQIPSGGQVNPAQSTFDDWLKWDPISSGVGDLLLDDMEKSFATSHTVAKTVKAINFTSNMNGLPAHGLQIKDLICLTNTTLEPPATEKFEYTAMETEKASAVEKPEDQRGLNPLHEQQNILPGNLESHSTLSEEQEEVILLPESQTSSSGVTNVYLASGSQDIKVSLDSVPKGPVALVPPPEEGQISVNHEKIEYQASGFEDSAMSSLPTYNSTYATEETVSISSEKLNYSNDLEANIVASKTQFLDTPSQVYEGNALHDVGQVQLEESNMENQGDVGVCAQECVAADRDLNKIDSEKQQGPSLASDDASSQVVDVDGELFIEMTNSSVKLDDGLPLEGSSYLTTDFNEPILDDVMGEREQIDPVTNFQRFG
ncbi:Protein subunit of nuclear ribonuclease P (RNase P) [Handroanthus impetiginosus]|uniref:Protein subunit of nuclear ribonuclease P (RNase P) n=1 Tax=Handroanthus impetiginosus TaxID=429701 RepID=A0A2G9G478_9LAMI|nr:Protein subunit of nuclear ribonuclease P (RNase P) [Handroanthus impetiginosus]